MSNADILQLAAEALADAAKLMPAPWTADFDCFSDNEGTVACVTNATVDHIIKIETDVPWVEYSDGLCVDEAVHAHWIAAARSREPQLAEACLALAKEVERLRNRQSELLQLVANISQSTPLDSEVADALNQRGAMLAEIGTLRSELAALRQVGAAK